jgi:hypothetical protein
MGPYSFPLGCSVQIWRRVNSWSIPSGTNGGGIGSGTTVVNRVLDQNGAVDPHGDGLALAPEIRALLLLARIRASRSSSLTLWPGRQSRWRTDGLPSLIVDDQGRPSLSKVSSAVEKKS